ncbi:MAG: surface carbohydrate biosynthesis protein [Rhodospirillaceae bacterium]
MDGGGRILYVPIETRAREFDARLFLTLKAAAANFQVILAHKLFLAANLKILPPGIFAFKTLNVLDAEAMRYARKLGHTIIAWDEEGPGQIMPEIYLRSIHDHAMQYAQMVFAWGEHQAAVLSEKYPHAKDNIRVHGNPRWDLLRPENQNYFEAEANAIRARCGRFILMNTNFATYNAVNGFDHIVTVADQVGAFKFGNKNDQRILKDIYAFEKSTFESYAAALPALSTAFPEHTIIVRPHPTEKQSIWHDLTAPYANVKTVYEGGVVPWLLAAEAVIQNSCTTGVEALTLGQPVVSYCRAQSPLQEWHLANQVCPRAGDEKSLIEHLRNFISDRASFAAHHAAGMRTLRKHISNLDGETSAAAIVNSLVALCDKLESEGWRFARGFNLPHGFLPYQANDYQRTKLPPIEPAEIAAHVKRISKLQNDIPAIMVSHIEVSSFYFRRGK